MSIAGPVRNYQYFDHTKRYDLLMTAMSITATMVVGAGENLRPQVTFGG